MKHHSHSLCDYIWKKCCQRDVVFLISNDNKDIKITFFKNEITNCNFSQHASYNAHSEMHVEIKGQTAVEAREDRAV